MSHNSSLASFTLGTRVLDDIERADSARSIVNEACDSVVAHGNAHAWTSVLGSYADTLTTPVLGDGTTLAALAKVQTDIETTLGEGFTVSELAKMQDSHHSVFSIASELTKFQDSYSSVFGIASELTKFQDSSVFSIASELTKFRDNHSSVFSVALDARKYQDTGSVLGIASPLTQIQESYSSTFEVTSALRKIQGSLGITSELTTIQDKCGSVFGMASELTKIHDSYASIVGVASKLTMTQSSTFDTTAAIASAIGALSFGFHHSTPETSNSTAHREMSMFGLNDESPENASEEEETAVEFVLNLPDPLKILLVTYCCDNRISVPHLIEHVLAAFFEIEPTPSPPKKERHLKLVR